MKRSKGLAIFATTIQALNLTNSFMNFTPYEQRWVYVWVFAFFVGLIPGYIANRKGYDFFTWWVYGWVLGLFPVWALLVPIVHSLRLKRKLPEYKITKADLCRLGDEGTTV